MKEYLKTAIKLTKNIGTTGAISEFSRFVEKEITQNVNPDEKQIIVEFGGGHGNMTRAILGRMHPDSQLFTFELHDDFIPILKEIDDSRLHVIHDSAAEILQYVQPKTVDCIVSTLPLTIIPKEIRMEIVGNAASALKESAVFSQALYTIRKDIINKHFKECSIEPMMNFPPAFVHHCKN
jgi:phospholipid N-methyltransferase